MTHTAARIALVCGNGISIDRAHSSGVQLHPSRPFSFDVRHPRRGTPLLHDLPNLRDWLATVPIEQSDFGRIERLLLDTVKASDRDRPSFDDRLVDLRHYLALGYSTYQLALDSASSKQWRWRQWLERYRKDVIVALSWNYDLVLERAFRWNGTRYFYPGAGGFPEWERKPEKRIGIPVCKPHGSCNFVSALKMRHQMVSGGPFYETDYPRAVLVMVADMPQTCLPDSRLLSVREVADIVLPGEFNIFGQELSWMQLATKYFRHLSARADTLVVIGFSMSKPDRDEFAEALSWCNRFQRVVIADPGDPQDLADFLAPRSATMSLWRDGPEML
jgi:hypothetical protein